MQSGSEDEIIEDEAPAAKPAAAPAGASPELEKILADFNEKAKVEGSVLVSDEGKVLVNLMEKADTASTGQTASKIFQNTVKAVDRMQLGAVEQIMIAGEDGRQILFVHLKKGVLMAITSTSSNLGMLRLAINELRKKAA